MCEGGGVARDQGRPRATSLDAHVYVCRRHDRRLARPAAHDRGDSGPGATFPSMRLLLAITFTEHSFFNQRLTVTLCTAETQHNGGAAVSFSPPSFAFDQYSINCAIIIVIVGMWAVPVGRHCTKGKKAHTIQKQNQKVARAHAIAMRFAMR